MPHFECKAGGVMAVIPEAAYRQVCKRHMTHASNRDTLLKPMLTVEP